MSFLTQTWFRHATAFDTVELPHPIKYSNIHTCNFLNLRFHNTSDERTAAEQAVDHAMADLRARRMVGNLSPGHLVLHIVVTDTQNKKEARIGHVFLVDSEARDHD